jgi:tyrosyl-tRNA synthetase
LEAQELTVADALVEAGLVKSKGEARRTVEQGGAYINNCRATAWDSRLTVEHLASETVMVVRRGKNKYGLLRFE